ncbi:cupin [Paractinoplanes abujensis]|uniref:Putative cupin superfamily sugar epimerase n=1 Tax=Paractinoplanes abujensis TaxID=882441 RepID=A0A7W7CJZ0_9ACTN|nr:cupin domain-containing protein [Actinoplanes abujensis]MBB4689971.1 putative cupin superfamily sugar epimerase [Actinoplanes abujensis]GID20744.1 cupin [Actinoplanes abujensis]
MTRPPLAEQFDLQPHPEGGWFRETFRSSTTITPDGYPGPRAAATAIYFLLNPGERSAWHVVRSDELWFWHSGGDLELSLGGAGEKPEPTATEVLGAGNPQVLIPAGVWQAAVPTGAEAVLVSCVVAPGFDFADFTLAAGA